MNNHQKVFGELIKAGIWERKVCLSLYNEIDFVEVYRLAEEQAVVGLVAAGIEHVVDVKVPQEVILTFIGSALQIEQRNIAMNSFIEALINKLREEDIYALLRYSPVL